MTIHNYKEFYKDDYNHSARLKEVFGKFKYKGCDYQNPNGINIEFKESHIFNIPENKVRFACYYKDVLGSDYMVFIYKDLIFVHKTKRVLGKYKFMSNKAIAQPYLSTIRKNYLRKFNKITELKTYLDGLK